MTLFLQETSLKGELNCAGKKILLLIQMYGTYTDIYAAPLLGCTLILLGLVSEEDLRHHSPDAGFGSGVHGNTGKRIN